jgi:formylglycine-generating enzyme required for sulfatase activity
MRTLTDHKSSAGMSRLTLAVVTAAFTVGTLPAVAQVEQKPDLKLAPADARRPWETTTKKAEAKPAAQTSAFRDCPVCPEMILIPAGSFQMGSNEFDEDPGEVPVTIKQPFAVGKFEVTFAEWEACVSDNGCTGNVTPSDNGWGKVRRPVINVSWLDAKDYVAWLSRKTGQTYRLLTSAEWEYAARARGKGRWTFGNNELQLPAYSWYMANSNKMTQPVGGKKPNGFGLHDMHGNVWEWVEDCYSREHKVPTDGTALSIPNCEDRTLRGGSWNGRSGHVRSAQLDHTSPNDRVNEVGFRVARTLSASGR